jgi:hypothetical protein
MSAMFTPHLERCELPELQAAAGLRRSVLVDVHEFNGAEYRYDYREQAHIIMLGANKQNVLDLHDMDAYLWHEVTHAMQFQRCKQSWFEFMRRYEASFPYGSRYELMIAREEYGWSYHEFVKHYNQSPYEAEARLNEQRGRLGILPSFAELVEERCDLTLPMEVNV